jgi:hypothetical protein
LYNWFWQAGFSFGKGIYLTLPRAEALAKVMKATAGLNARTHRASLHEEPTFSRPADPNTDQKEP